LKGPERTPGTRRLPIDSEAGASRVAQRGGLSGKLARRPHVALLPEQNVRTNFLEPADFEAIAAHLREDLLDFSRFAYLTGWRSGAIRVLGWRNVDLERRGDEIVGGFIRPEGSSVTKRTGLVALSGEVLEIIRRRFADRRLDCSLVFHHDGRAVGDFRRAWLRAAAAAGFAGVRFHDLRRSFARNISRAGVSEQVAMLLGGWRTRSVFDRYRIVSEGDVAEALSSGSRPSSRSAEGARQGSRRLRRRENTDKRRTIGRERRDGGAGNGL
jgi:integrase